MRKKIVAGNWKMNTSFEEAQKLASEIINMGRDEVGKDVTLILIPPFTYLSKVNSLIGQRSNIYLGAQNCNENLSGAYTGEISPEMLKSVGCEYVVLGHSERREYYSESNELLTRKVDAAHNQGLIPIFCIGEPLEVREAGEHVDYVINQLEESIFKLDADRWSKIVLAYEPIWAIGTGKTATSEQAQEMHHEIRIAIADKYNSSVAEEVSILYGGSVKPANSEQIFSQTDVDGGLIGGASLKSRDFIDIALSF